MEFEHDPVAEKELAKIHEDFIREFLDAENTIQKTLSVQKWTLRVKNFRNHFGFY